MRSARSIRRRRSAGPRATVRRGAAALLAVAALAGYVTAARAQTVTEVKVERVRPQRERHPTLQFLKENRDFIRARFDLLRQKPVDRHGRAGEIDPRFLEYDQMLAAILSARDSTATADDTRRRQELLASITELGRLEAPLDLMDRLLAEQRRRLGVLQEDFAGRQQTALMVVLSGYPGDAPVSEIAITLEDGARLTVPLSLDERESLKHGGVVQVFHGFVEPRKQVIEVGLTGERWPGGDSCFVTLDPARDRLSLLRLDLSPVEPGQGAASIKASTWLHVTKPRTGDG